MFQQILDPTGNLFVTWLVALIPVVLLLVLLAGFRMFPSYMRVGGLREDLPRGFHEAVRDFLMEQKLVDQLPLVRFDVGQFGNRPNWVGLT